MIEWYINPYICLLQQAQNNNNWSINLITIYPDGLHVLQRYNLCRILPFVSSLILFWIFQRMLLQIETCSCYKCQWISQVSGLILLFHAFYIEISDVKM